ncbi:hypothetical protein HOL21_00070 [Candidatus Woesearchaeota archaeon]|nr:hypothetical protein [Candidatus Woesearchaeota archaeon]MBT5396595.1 hypothetical protein [Candidatus Woesearchaeota archaeon]MBT6367989.1 hypothetical protein [Candidatus Woesearchaeota archaeon]MBT7762239.1 hypothetical protein [Candidatus Woesearchaeota archaeon]
MGAKNKKVENKRLDLLFRDIEVEEKRKVLENVETLTFEAIQRQSKPQLRLKK